MGIENNIHHLSLLEYSLNKETEKIVEMNSNSNMFHNIILVILNIKRNRERTRL